MSVWCRVGLHRWRHYSRPIQYAGLPERGTVHHRRRCTRVGCSADRFDS